jgi:hypothetical protein
MSEEREREIDYFSSPLSSPESEAAVAAVDTAADDAASVTEALVPSVNHAASADRRLNSASGRPGSRYWLIAGCSVLEGAHFLAGTCITPGVLEAWEAGDTLSLVAQCCAVICFNGAAVNLWWGLSNVRSGEDGVLHQLGVGRVAVSIERWKPVEKILMNTNMMLYVVSHVLILGGISSVILVTGRGAQSSALYNRISAVIFSVLMIGLDHPDGIKAHTLTSAMATAVVSQQVEDVTRAVVACSAGDEAWNTKVVDPVLRLVKSLRLISGAWGHVIAFSMVQLGAILPFVVCNVWSSLVQQHLAAFGAEKGLPWLAPAVSWGFTAMSAMLPFMLYNVVLGPASISTACDELKAALNQARLDGLTAENSARIELLERALDRENNGSGIGFTILGFVVNKRMLNQIASGVIGVVLFVLPLVIQSAVQLSPEGLMQVERDLIAPLRAENAALLAALGALNATCMQCAV